MLGWLWLEVVVAVGVRQQQLWGHFIASTTGQSVVTDMPCKDQKQRQAVQELQLAHDVQVADTYELPESTSSL